MGDCERLYLADPRQVFQVRGIALVLTGRAVNVVRRTDNRFWRYAISRLELDKATQERWPGFHCYSTFG